MLFRPFARSVPTVTRTVRYVRQPTPVYHPSSSSFHTTTAKMAAPILITSREHLNELTSGYKHVLVDCYADWCGPCKAIAPIFAAKAAEISKPGHVAFAKLDVDALPDVAQELGISAMPTFLFFEDGQESEKIVGADVPKLTAGFARLAAYASSIEA